MAKKARRKSAAKRKSKAKPSKAAAKKNKIRKARRKPAKGKIKRAYRTVIDTFKGTDRLRNRLEQPGTSETE